MIDARLGADLRLPGARTKEQDAVAMLDEGGVVVLRAGDAPSAVIFGHAICEGARLRRAAERRVAGVRREPRCARPEGTRAWPQWDGALGAVLSGDAGELRRLRDDRDRRSGLAPHPSLTERV